MSELSYVMPEVKKVIIEPCGILSNNTAFSPSGTAMIAIVGHKSGIPVIMLCPSSRFISKVGINGFTPNEILAQEFLKPRQEWAGVKMDSLALVDDIIPGQFVDIVMCEIENLSAARYSQR
jgi:translation initiation factor 2B subunit (eIF-2B alpha/beta/delta family)